MENEQRRKCQVFNLLKFTEFELIGFLNQYAHTLNGSLKEKCNYSNVDIGQYLNVCYIYITVLKDVLLRLLSSVTS